MHTVLVTGATGVIGAELCRVLSRRAKVLAVIRGDSRDVTAKERWLRGWVGDTRSHVEVIRGDITVEGLGLDADAWRAVADADSVIHAAANISLTQHRESAVASNVEGTRRVIALAESLPRLSRFTYVSTAFVHGKAPGHHLEDTVVDPRGSFENEYERSKAEAEALCRGSTLPWTIVRPSIVLGRSADGAIARMRDAVYFMIRRVQEGLLPMFPGDADATVDLVPLDFVARAIEVLTLDRGETFKSYHLCAGPTRSLGVQALFELIWDTLAERVPGWRERGFPRPMAVAPEIFEDFVDTVMLVGNFRLREVAARVDELRRPLDSAKTFDTTHVEAALEGTGLVVPHARDWFAECVARAAAEGYRPASWHDLVTGAEG